VIVRWWLDQWLGDALPLVTLYGAVAASVWVGGYRMGALAAAVGYLACDYLFIDPRGVLELSSTSTIVGAAAYTTTCAIVIGLGEAMHQARVALSEQRERLRATLAGIDDAVLTADLNGRVTSMNRAAEALGGISIDQAVGRRLSDVFQVVSEETGDPIPNPALDVAGKGSSASSLRQGVLIGNGGARRLVEHSVASVCDEHAAAVGSVVVFRDITERRQAQTGRKREEETRSLLAAIVAASDDAIVSKTLEGIVLSWNEGAQRLFGYSPEEAVGQSINLIIPHELRQEERQILDRIRRGLRVDHFETVRVAKDGRRLDISLTVSPLRDESGRVIGASKVARDITDRKRMDAALRDADRRKDEFLATLAHELRNPLAPIRHSLAVLVRSQGDRDLFRRCTDILDRQVSHLVHLVDDLLDVSRITRDMLQLRKAPVDLASIIRQVAEAGEPLASQAQQTVELSLPDQPIYLEADPVRLTQVFSNLFINACHYSTPGGHIWITVEQQHGEAVALVRDGGIGLPADQIDGIFEMFAQLDTGGERAQRGLGIGLTLVRRLVQLHGGTVTARSAGPGLGSEFEVRLPLLEGAPTFEPPMPARARTNAARTVLVVDDNEDGADSIATLLRLDGHRTHTVYDGLAAVEAAEHLRPDIVLLDVGLPRISGLEVCRRIRSHSWGKAMLIVALTGWGQEHDRRITKEAGFDAHLVKPVNFDELLQLLSMPNPLSQIES
jgi:PAS domain S-box-containing protein